MAMAISADNLFRGRKYPFIFSLFILLIILLFSFIFLFDSQSSPLNFTSDLTATQPAVSSTSPPPPSADSSPPPPPSAPKTVSNPSIFPSHVVVLPNTTTDVADLRWRKCAGSVAVDYIPCLDNLKAIKELKWRRHMEHKERHCPNPSPRCLIPIPRGYKVPVPWPKSRDMVWFDNVPHPKLVEYKKDQNWVQKSGDYLVFPGGGTQFKEGVMQYIEHIEKTLPMIKWGKRTRVILDVGCGVASFGGYLLDKDVITVSFAPNDQHEAQIQFALERGIPATLSVIGTQRLTFPDNVYDLIHCARCRVHWDGNGGKPLMELNRVLRPGGFFIWSATPVYRTDEKDRNVWNSIVALTGSICWKVVAKSFPSTGIGVVIYHKPVSFSCYARCNDNKPPMCDQNRWKNMSWYTPLDTCLPPLPLPSQGSSYKWPILWPKRLSSKLISLSTELDAEEIFYEDTEHWYALVLDVYLEVIVINWPTVRNVMDMNEIYQISSNLILSSLSNSLLKVYRDYKSVTMVNFIKWVAHSALYAHDFRMDFYVYAEWNHRGFSPWLHFIHGIQFRTEMKSLIPTINDKMSPRDSSQELQEQALFGSMYDSVDTMLHLGILNIDCDMVVCDDLLNTLKFMNSFIVDGFVLGYWSDKVEAHAPPQYSEEGCKQLFQVDESGGNFGMMTQILLLRCVAEIVHGNPQLCLRDKERKCNLECITWGLSEDRVLRYRTAKHFALDNGTTKGTPENNIGFNTIEMLSYTSGTTMQSSIKSQVHAMLFEVSDGIFIFRSRTQSHLEDKVGFEGWSIVTNVNLVWNKFGIG